MLSLTRKGGEEKGGGREEEGGWRGEEAGGKLEGGLSEE